MPPPDPRRLFCVMGVQSLPYAQPCLASLIRNAIEDLDVTLITDSDADAALLRERVTALGAPARHRFHIHAKAEADGRAEQAFAGFPALATLRAGHPCWRKITDPLLFADTGQEIILLDPDVYFPNAFAFEPTPQTGLLLMWQRPNCLYPEEVVRRAYRLGIAMADHTDIGVCQFRTPLPLALLDDLVRRISVGGLPRSMHVESILWAALAERLGGGYLDPGAWHCFANSVAVRARRRIGQDGLDQLRRLDIPAMKAFHAGGVAKYWLAEAEAAGLLHGGSRLDRAIPATPFVPYPRAKFETKMARNRIARGIGLYRMLGSAG